jgi:hypothetical protein
MHASRLNERGVARDRHDTRGGDAVDAEVAQTNATLADVKSCGPGIPTLMPSCLGDDPRDDGGQKARCTEESTYKC